MKKTLAPLAVALAMGTSAASASGVSVTYQDSLFGANLYKDVKISHNGTAKTVRAGMFHLDGGSALGDFVAFCVDLAQTLADPQTVEEKPDLFSMPVRANIDKLFSSVIGTSNMVDAIKFGATAAGFQLALWEIIYETDDTFDLSSGSFKRNGGSANTAWSLGQGYLDTLASEMGGDQKLTYYSSEDGQDLVTGNPTPVPVPASGLMVLAGLGGLAALKRRKAK